jgi:hypothetical protein
MSNSTVETTIETTPKRSIDELIYYLNSKVALLKGSFSRASHEGFIDFTFSVSDIEKEIEIAEQSIQRLYQAKEDEDFYKDVYEMFHQMTKSEKHKTLLLLKRVLESQVNNNDILKNLASAVMESR